jgi:hypothetical protein
MRGVDHDRPTQPGDPPGSATWETDGSLGPEDELVEGELVAPADELPVLLEARVLEQPRRSSIPVVHTAVAAATGFVAGAATLALLRRYNGRLAREAEALGESLDQVRRPPRQTTTYLVQVRAVERHID